MSSYESRYGFEKQRSGRPLRLDEKLAAETLEVKKRLRQRNRFHSAPAGSPLGTSKSAPQLPHVTQASWNGELNKSGGHRNSDDESGDGEGSDTKRNGRSPSSLFPDASTEKRRRRKKRPKNALMKSTSATRARTRAVQVEKEGLSGKEWSAGEITHNQKLSKLSGQVQELQVMYNTLRAEEAELARAVRVSDDRLTQLRQEDDVEEQRQQGLHAIAALERRLRKTQKRLTYQLTYRNTLRHMLQRLKTDRLTYDNTLRAYEEALSVRRRESAEMKLTSAEVRQAKEAEEGKLARLKEVAEEQKRAWEEELSVRRSIARKREEMKKWFEQRRLRDSDVAASVEGDMDEGEEARYRARAASNTLKAGGAAHNLSELRKQVSVFEEAFQKIRVATGLVHEEDIIDRFNHRDEHANKIDSQIQELQSSIQELKLYKLELGEKLENVKFSGMGVSDFNREMVDGLSAQAETARRQLKLAKEEHERVEKMVMEIKQSVAALSAKLDSVRVDANDNGSRHAQLAKFGLDHLAGADTVSCSEKIAGITTKLGKILEVMKTTPDTNALQKFNMLASAFDDDNSTVSGADAAAVPSGRESLASARRVGTAGSVTPSAAAAAAASTSGGGGSGSGFGNDTELTAQINESDLSSMMETIMAANKLNVRVAPRRPSSALSDSFYRRPATADTEEEGGSAVADGGLRSMLHRGSTMRSTDPFMDDDLDPVIDRQSRKLMSDEIRRKAAERAQPKKKTRVKRTPHYLQPIAGQKQMLLPN